MRPLAVLVLLAACGRVNFDELSDADSVAARCPPVPTLAACYEFEGTTTDGSQYGNHATGTEISFAPGRYGLAVTITDASNIIAPDSASLDIATALTIEAWVNPTMLSTGRSVIVDHQDHFAVFLRDGLLGMSVQFGGGTSGVFEAPADIGVTRGWMHVAVTYDGTAGTLWLDGTAIAVEPFSMTIVTGAVEGMRIGGDFPAGQPLLGALDELRIWNVARSAADLCASAGSC